MSYSDYEEDSEVEVEAEEEVAEEDKTLKEMVIYCKYGWASNSSSPRPCTPPHPTHMF